MTIKDRLSALKNRYIELLEETQKSNENWGDDTYTKEEAKELADQVWTETKKFYGKATRHIITNCNKKNKSKGLNPFTWKPDLFY